MYAPENIGLSYYLPPTKLFQRFGRYGNPETHTSWYFIHFSCFVQFLIKKML